VDAFIRLGQKDRALQLLRTLLADRRPPGWNEWAEVSWHDAQTPRFIGDMPHTWVGSTFVRAVRSFFAYEHDADESVIVGAGVMPEWVTADPGVVVKRLPTHYGVLNYSARATGPDTVRIRLAGDLTVPPGGIVVVSPLARPLRGVRVNGRAVASGGDAALVVREMPAEVVFEYGRAGGDGAPPAGDSTPPAS
jgi:hypothetical protein